MEDDGFASAVAYFGGCLEVEAEVDVLAAHLEEAIGLDEGDKLGDGAVVEVLWRGLGLEGQVDVDGVALVGTDEGLVGVEGESLLVVGGDDVLEEGHVDVVACLVQLLDEVGDGCPALGVQLEANGLRLVTEDKAEKLRDGACLFFVKCFHCGC